ncbi:MAG: ATP-binding cassette domain-containing protein, partial [Clostridiales Family XIII bacterium]|nr:ATP-binding cassette domain-containing protein [Clostridiales Family XIII bacterium]
MKILEMKGISKSFFGVEVLHKVDFSVNSGEVHALLGENGAGKSTLMNILGGVHKRDAGVIVFDDKVLTHATVQGATDAGIAFVHQELNVINDLKVYENIFLNKEILNKFRKIKKKEMLNRSRDLFERLGVEIDPNETVS